jgi:hypothetical protein
VIAADPGGSSPTRLALFFFLTVSYTACGSSTTGPSDPPPPPPVNSLPVVTSIFVKATLSREPAQYATLGETVNVTATVTDAETPVNQLTYEWSSSVGGTFSANASTATWTAPATLTGTTPVNATLTLTVTERIDATRNNRVTATTVVDLHNSAKEVGDLARQFLLDFSRQLPVDMVMRNFTSTCPEAAQEREQVATSNESFEIVEYRVDEAVTTVPFSGSCPFRNVRGDACAQVPVYWRAVDKKTGVAGSNGGIDQVTALLENGVWRLCASDYDLRVMSGDTGLGALMSRPFVPR